MFRRSLYTGRYRVEPAGVSVSVNRPYYTVSVAGLFHLRTGSGPVRRLSSRVNRTSEDEDNEESQGQRKSTALGSQTPHSRTNAK